MAKRLFDILFSGVGLILMAPIFIMAAVMIKADDGGPVFFRQERIGMNFRAFRIFKFRTMSAGSEKRGSLITVAGDERITRSGHFLRKFKIDELPQLINVLKGEMSFVGPRPEVGKYVQLFKSEYRELLSARPGITDPASIEFSAEETVLASSANTWEDEYIGRILPEKIQLSLRYARSRNVLSDLKLIFKTVFKISAG